MFKKIIIFLLIFQVIIVTPTFAISTEYLPINYLASSNGSEFSMFGRGSFTVNDNVFECISNGVNKYPYLSNISNMTIPANHKIFIRVDISVYEAGATSIDITINETDIIQKNIATYPLPNNIYDVNFTATTTATLNKIYFQVAYNTPAESLNKKFTLKNMYLIDLTATYGAGNEPTAKQMNDFVTNSYVFDSGTYFLMKDLKTIQNNLFSIIAFVSGLIIVSIFAKGIKTVWVGIWCMTPWDGV